MIDCNNGFENGDFPVSHEDFWDDMEERPHWLALPQWSTFLYIISPILSIYPVPPILAI